MKEQRTLTEQIKRRAQLVRQRDAIGADINQLAAARDKIIAELGTLPGSTREVRRALDAVEKDAAHDVLPCAKCAGKEIGGRLAKRHHKACWRRGNPRAVAA